MTEAIGARTREVLIERMPLSELQDFSGERHSKGPVFEMIRVDTRTAIRLWLIIGPGVAVYAFIVVAPLLGGFWYSLHDTRNYQFQWNGLQNYVDLFRDSDFYYTLTNNLIIIGSSIFMQIGAAFLIAVFMYSRFAKFRTFLRVAIFLPVILSPIVTSFVWMLVYDINKGLLNSLLKLVGLEHLQQYWLDNPDIVLYSVIVALSWQYIGLFLVIFLAGLTAINPETIDAAEVDGATFMQKTFLVILPQTIGTWTVAIVLAISGGLKIFEHTFIMTGGGPGLASTVVAQYAYNQAFLRAQFAYSNTIAVVIVVISLSLVFLSILLINRYLVRGD